jgi:hypothetical protein
MRTGEIGPVVAWRQGARRGIDERGAAAVNARTQRGQRAAAVNEKPIREAISDARRLDSRRDNGSENG